MKRLESESASTSARLRSLQQSVEADDYPANVTVESGGERARIPSIAAYPDVYTDGRVWLEIVVYLEGFPPTRGYAGFVQVRGAEISVLRQMVVSGGKILSVKVDAGTGQDWDSSVLFGSPQRLQRPEQAEVPAMSVIRLYRLDEFLRLRRQTLDVLDSIFGIGPGPAGPFSAGPTDPIDREAARGFPGTVNRVFEGGAEIVDHVGKDKADVRVEVPDIASDLATRLLFHIGPDGPRVGFVRANFRVEHCQVFLRPFELAPSPFDWRNAPGTPQRRVVVLHGGLSMRHRSRMRHQPGGAQ